MRKTIGFTRKTLYFTRKTLDFTRKTLDFTRKTLDFTRKTVIYDTNGLPYTIHALIVTIHLKSTQHHYLSECPANRTERRKLLTDDMFNITDSHKKATAILNSQARTGHIKLMQLIRKYPVMQ